MTMDKPPDNHKTEANEKPSGQPELTILTSEHDFQLNTRMFSNPSSYPYVSNKRQAAREQHNNDERLAPVFFKRPAISKKSANLKKGLFSFKKNKKPAANNNQPQLLATVSMPIVKFDDDADMPVEKKIIYDTSLNQLDDVYNTESYAKPNSKDDDHLYGVNMRKLRDYMKTVMKFSFGQIGLAGLVVAYVILGAVIIMRIENAYEQIKKGKLQNTREEFVRNVRLSSENLVNEYLRNNFHEKYNQFRDEEIHCTDFRSENNETSIHTGFIKIRPNQTLPVQNASNQTTKSVNKPAKKCDVDSLWFIKIDEKAFRERMVNSLDIFLNEIDKNEDKDKSFNSFDADVWTYSSSILFSVTVITTVGYGNITPKSITGKLFTMLYAFIGIPLMFMMLANTGDLLVELFINSYSKTVRFIKRTVCKHKLKMFYSASNYKENKKEMLTDFEIEYDNPEDRHVPILATLGILSAYIFMGAVIFSYWEQWSYLDGAYFCFVTFTTIGFGDFVPGKNTLSTDKYGKFILCAVYLILGMMIMSMCIKLLQTEVVMKVMWLGRRLGIIDRDS